ncbi:hypothetical protein S58_27320 [Bradyrhizobium oligotrophicum S58]|uniref:Uncharacterized protein n=1 Tax=Bradyrhizobium oligotrophicum S58 TaxID=1245469 RepID=M4Z5I6_9BRAD|nr:hypothetical protein S58_27320 [Bradyrhizobium oligotrophicum S58]
MPQGEAGKLIAGQDTVVVVIKRGQHTDEILHVARLNWLTPSRRALEIESARPQPGQTLECLC